MPQKYLTPEAAANKITTWEVGHEERMLISSDNAIPIHEALRKIDPAVSVDVVTLEPRQFLIRRFR
jgi:hypothetical protein